jgi:adenine-specific DNA-methyltransferase
MNVADKKKRLGQVFTPEKIVKVILDRLEYIGEPILSKTVLEPGCGVGNFLLEVVERYVMSALDCKWTSEQIVAGLEKNIWGIEIDPIVYNKCINDLNFFIQSRLGKGFTINWKIFNSDILDVDFSNFPHFDYVVGNPPYVRIHHLDKNKLDVIKSRFKFCRSGIIDLFLVFFELGLNSLNRETGKLGMITPNSFIHNSTYVPFREHLAVNCLIKELIDFRSSSVFQDASTYNAITIIDMSHRRPEFVYSESDGESITLINNIDLRLQDHKKWNLTDSNDAKFLFWVKEAKCKISDCANVQYGFATLRDSVYVFDRSRQGLFNFLIEDNLLYRVVKASRYAGNDIHQQIIYPYERNGNSWVPIAEEKMRAQYPNAYNYLLQNENELKSRDMDKNASFWYEYGRSQGVQTIHHEKLVISPIFKDEIRVNKVDEKTMVYSGIFLFLKDNSKVSLEDIAQILRGDKFLRYAKILGKNMSGGYQTINTKAIKDFRIE